jgi:ABC-type nitrate/sulfonate/bicarbonate transport system substrate-binding protein
MKHIIALLLLLILTVAGTSNAAELKKLKVGYLPTSGHLLYFVA